MNTYQLTIHFSPQLSKEKSEQLQSEIIDQIEKRGGSLIEKNSISKVQLNYTISDFSQAVLWDIDIKLSGDKVQKIKTYLADQPKVLRAMVTRKDGAEKKKRPSPGTKKNKDAEKDKKEPKKKEPKKEKTKKKNKEKKDNKADDEKVELNNIDDKLDQILEEDL